MTKKTATKTKLVNFRVREDTKIEFEVVAEMRKIPLSTLIHQLLYAAVREEQERNPKKFAEILQNLIKINTCEEDNIVESETHNDATSPEKLAMKFLPEDEFKEEVEESAKVEEDKKITNGNGKKADS